MIVRTTDLKIDAYAGEHIDKFVDRIVRVFNEERNYLSTINGPAQRNNVTITGNHNDTIITLSIQYH